MYDLNEEELASVVGGNIIIKTAHSRNVVVVVADTAVYVTNAHVDYSYVGDNNGAVITIYTYS